jgi:hypothetical protein
MPSSDERIRHRALGALGVGSLIVLLVALVAVPLVMAMWFAPALVVFGADPIGAMRSSFVAPCATAAPDLRVARPLFAIVATIPSASAGRCSTRVRRHGVRELQGHLRRTSVEPDPAPAPS